MAEYSDMSDFTFSTPKALIEMGRCSCGQGVVYGRDDNGVKRYLRTEAKREITLCSVCDEKAHPPESSKHYEKITDLVNDEDILRKEYSIPPHRGVKEWLHEMDGQKVTVNSFTVTVNNVYNRKIM